MASSVQPFIFEWLQKHLDHYQYRTDEARKLKNEIQGCDISTPEGALIFPALYSDFASMCERNPFDGSDRKGDEAAILADSLPYFFYPNGIGEYQPLAVQFEWGAMGVEARAEVFSGKIRRSIDQWAVQAAEGYRRKKEKFYAGKEQIRHIYGNLLENGLSPSAYWVLQTALLFLIFLCVIAGAAAFLSEGFGALFPAPRVRFVGDVGVSVSAGWIFLNLSEYITPEGITFIFCCLITLVMLARSVFWIIRERRREALITNWKELLSEEPEKDEENTVPADSFRSPEGFARIFDEQLNVARDGVYTLSEEGKETAAGLPAKGSVIDYDRYLQKKNIASVNTVRVLHLFVTGLTLIAFLVLSPQKLIPAVGSLEEKAQEAFDSTGLMKREIVTHEDAKMEDLKGSLNFGIFVSEAEGGLYSAPTGKQSDFVFSLDRGSSLTVIDAVKGDDGNGWYKATTSGGTTGYISFSDCQLRKSAEGSIKTAVVGSETESGQLDVTGILTDGKADRAASLMAGETLTLNLENRMKVKALYMAPEAGNDEKIRKAAIVINGSEEYDINVGKYSDLGLFVRIGDLPAGQIEITLPEEEDTAVALSEIAVYGERIG